MQWLLSLLVSWIGQPAIARNPSAVPSRSPASVVTTAQRPSFKKLFQVPDGFYSSLYTCSREMATLNRARRPLGPLFTEDHIVFGSVDLGDGLHGDKKFFILTPSGVYAAALEEVPIHNLRFVVGSKTYYVVYMHGDILGNRYLEFSINHAPAGKTREDFRPVTLTPSPQLNDVVLNLLSDQLDQILSGMSDGNVARTKADPESTRACQFLLAKTILRHGQFKRNMDVLALWTSEARADRAPASL